MRLNIRVMVGVVLAIILSVMQAGAVVDWRMPLGQSLQVRAEHVRIGTATTDGQLEMYDSGTLRTFTAAGLASLDTSGATAGDILYFDGTEWAKLAKSASATRSLTNTGASNIPAWAQVNLANGVTGTLDETNGGTGAATVTQGDVLYGSAADTWAKLAKSARAGMALQNTGASNSPAWGPLGVVLYQSLTASAAHDGTTAAETTVMPATDEGTGDTDLAAWLLTGAGFDFDVFVRATGDADGDETLTVKVYFGAVEVASSGAIDVDGNIEIKIDGEVFISAGGATGTGDYSFVSWAASTPTMNGADIGSTDFTAVTPFAVKLDWGGTTDAADAATVETARVTVNNFD